MQEFLYIAMAYRVLLAPHHRPVHPEWPHPNLPAFVHYRKEVDAVDLPLDAVELPLVVCSNSVVIHVSFINSTHSFPS